MQNLLALKNLVSYLANLGEELELLMNTLRVIHLIVAQRTKQIQEKFPDISNQLINLLLKLKHTDSINEAQDILTKLIDSVEAAVFLKSRSFFIIKDSKLYGMLKPEVRMSLENRFKQEIQNIDWNGSASILKNAAKI